ncbi:MAG: RNA-binding protein [Gammaproteobacteria bacterium]|nr:RNA-binding protein [Gammaproteobacteria bacterium]
MKIYVEHLPWYASSDDLRKLCSPFGEVLAATVMFNWNTQRSLGYGLVSMTEGDGRKAIKALNGSMFNLNKLKVQIARTKAI